MIFVTFRRRSAGTESTNSELYMYPVCLSTVAREKPVFAFLLFPRTYDWDREYLH